MPLPCVAYIPHLPAGTVVIDIVEFRTIESSALEAASGMFVAPLQTDLNATFHHFPSIPRPPPPFKARWSGQAAGRCWAARWRTSLEPQVLGARNTCGRGAGML